MELGGRARTRSAKSDEMEETDVCVVWVRMTIVDETWRMLGVVALRRAAMCDER